MRVMLFTVLIAAKEFAPLAIAVIAGSSILPMLGVILAMIGKRLPLRVAGIERNKILILSDIASQPLLGHLRTREIAFYQVCTGFFCHACKDSPFVAISTHNGSDNDLFRVTFL